MFSTCWMFNKCWMYSTYWMFSSYWMFNTYWMYSTYWMFSTCWMFNKCWMFITGHRVFFSFFFKSSPWLDNAVDDHVGRLSTKKRNQIKFGATGDTGRKIEPWTEALAAKIAQSFLFNFSSARSVPKRADNDRPRKTWEVFLFVSLPFALLMTPNGRQTRRTSSGKKGNET